MVDPASHVMVRRAAPSRRPSPKARAETTRAKALRRGAGLALLLMLSAEILAYGGSRAEVGLAFAAVELIAPLAFLALQRDFELERAIDGRLLPAIALFVGVEAWAAFTLLPVLPQGFDAARGAFGPALSVDRAATITEMIKLGGLAGVLVCGLVVAARPRAAWRLLDLLALLTIAYGVWAIGAFVTGKHWFYDVDKGYALHRRLSASFLSANTAGSLFGALAALFGVACVAVFPSRSARSGRWKVSRQARVSTVAYPLATLISLGALWFSASRGAVLATTAVGVGAVGAGLWRGGATSRLSGVQRGAVAAVGALLALVLVIGGPMLAGGVTAWRFGYAQDTAGERTRVLHDLMRIAAHRPLTGYGLGAFRDALRARTDVAAFPDMWDFGAAHDLFFQWWIEGGLPGLLLMSGAVTVLLVALGRVAQSRGERAGRARAVAAFSTVLLLHNLIDFSLQVPAVTGLWAFLLGLALGGPLTGAPTGPPTGLQTRPPEPKLKSAAR